MINPDEIPLVFAIPFAAILWGLWFAFAVLYAPDAPDEDYSRLDHLDGLDTRG